jgi:hypothetical protein
MIIVTVDGSVQRVMTGARLIDASTATEARFPRFVTAISLVLYKPLINA